MHFHLYMDSSATCLHTNMTHDPSVPYPDYVARLKPNPIARRVKLADLRHNSDLTRLDRVREEDLRRVRKYAAAIRLLEEPEV